MFPEKVFAGELRAHAGGERVADVRHRDVVAAEEFLFKGKDAEQAVDDAARSIISAAGHGDHFGHGLGHGVGLDIHEVPFLGFSATGILGDRTPVTVEPGVYLPGRGGVRIEDTLVVRTGGPVSLTTTTRDLLVL